MTFSALSAMNRTTPIDADELFAMSGSGEPGAMTIEPE